MISSSYVATSGSTQYDTRKASVWVTPDANGNAVAYLRAHDAVPVAIPEPAFSTAKTAAVGAASPQ